MWQDYALPIYFRLRCPNPTIRDSRSIIWSDFTDLSVIHNYVVEISTWFPSRILSHPLSTRTLNHVEVRDLTYSIEADA